MLTYRSALSLLPRINIHAEKAKLFRGKDGEVCQSLGAEAGQRKDSFKLPSKKIRAARSDS